MPSRYGASTSPSPPLTEPERDGRPRLASHQTADARERCLHRRAHRRGAPVECGLIGYVSEGILAECTPTAHQALLAPFARAIRGRSLDLSLATRDACEPVTRCLSGRVLRNDARYEVVYIQCASTYLVASVVYPGIVLTIVGIQGPAAVDAAHRAARDGINSFGVYARGAIPVRRKWGRRTGSAGAAR